MILDGMPWRRVEQYIVEICRRSGVQCERKAGMGKAERQALELLRDFTNFRRAEIAENGN